MSGASMNRTDVQFVSVCVLCYICTVRIRCICVGVLCVFALNDMCACVCMSVCMQCKNTLPDDPFVWTFVNSTDDA